MSAVISRRRKWGAQHSTGNRKCCRRLGIGGELHDAIPIGRGTKQNVRRAVGLLPMKKREFLQSPGIVRGVHSHVFAVKHIDHSLLARRHQFVRMRAILVRQDEHSTRTQIKVVLVKERHTPRGKVIEHLKGGRKLHDAVAIRLSALRNIVSIDARLRRLNVDVPRFIGSETIAALPDGGESVIGRGIEDTRRRQAGFVISKDPATIASVAGVRTKSYVNRPIAQQKSGTIFLILAVEYGNVSLLTHTLCRDQNGTAWSIIAGSNVDGVNIMLDGTV